MDCKRDCEHGSQIGKCYICDLAEAENKIAALEKERDEANCHAYYILDTCTVFSPKKLEAHNLEQQAKGIEDLAEMMFTGGSISTTGYDMAFDYADKLREGVTNE